MVPQCDRMLEYKIMNGNVTGDIRKDLEESGCSVIEVLP
jgi:hypothetical protein